jgi:hypothetical protein
MALRRAHGTGSKALVRVETLSADELPAGMPAHAGAVSRAASAESGPFAEGNQRSVMGGYAKRGRVRFATRLGLSTLPEGNAFAPYRRSAASFRIAQCGELARNVGGGVCGPGPSSIVASAAIAIAWSRFLSDQAAATGNVALAVMALRAADMSRQMLLTAHELCAREAAARPKPAVDPLAAIRARIGERPE